MAFANMSAEIRGCVPKLPITYAKTLVNRAWRVVRESNLWSFNLIESSWISPPLVNTGTVTLVQGSAQITFDSLAISALLAAQATQTYSLLTQRQFRQGVGGIYSLIALDANFAANGIATLDRIFADPGGAGKSYQVYQLYYPAPTKDFLTWLSVRNPVMFLDLDLNMTRAQIDAQDPQRSWYQFPTCVVPYAIDTRPGSATLGFPLYELWGQPIAPFVYQCYGVRRGADLLLPTDTLPASLDEALVLAKARVLAYEWAEANKDMSPRSTGPDWRFLMGKAEDEFKSELKRYRKQDKEFCDNWFSVRTPAGSSQRWGYYNTIAGFAGPYSPG